MDQDALLKDLVWDALVRAALKRLFTAIPLLGLGPVGVVVGFIVNRFADKLFEELKLAINLQVIAIRNEEHRRVYAVASAVLRQIGHDKGIDSPEFQRARDESKAALARFVRFAQ